jgi:unsaturated rhamnogalacturonyl hydrolase
MTRFLCSAVSLFALLTASFALASSDRASLPPAAEIEQDLANIYAIKPAQLGKLRRGPIMQETERLMIQQARALMAELQPWSVDASAALMPLRKGVASSEHGIRPNAATAKGLAILVRLAPDEAFPADFTRAQARERALAMLRYLLRTHGAGGETCADGKPWRNQWQSAYWAAMTGEASWLLWDDLTPAERWLAARMICDEADRFAGQKPPTQVTGDTKAEENAWNSQIISLAYNQFPAHPHNRRWRDEAIRWILSSFATRADVASDEVVDRRPLRVWLEGLGPNIHDDFTLENHRRVHPDYMACTYLLTSQATMYAWGGNKAPEAIQHNLAPVARVLQGLATPDGSVLYPNGQDWGLRRNVEWFEFHATNAVLRGDATSAALMRESLVAVRRMATRDPRGLIYLPTETKLSSDQHMLLEYLAHTYALMGQRGEGPAPLRDEELTSSLAGTRVFQSGRFGAVRTTDSIASFSWGAQVMGQVLPLRPDLLFSPEMRGLIGHVAVEGVAREVPVAREVAVAPLVEGLGVTGVLERGGGFIEQRFGFLALPDGRVVYVDRVALMREARPTLLHLGTLGVLNDVQWPFHDGSRKVIFAGGEREFVATQATMESAAEFSAPWLNVDRGFGIVRLAAAGPALYTPAPTNAAGRLEQRLNLSVVPAPVLAAARPGERLAQGAFVFYPNQTAEQTAAAAARCALLSTPEESRVRLRLEDGLVVEFDLAALRLRLTPPAPAAPSAAEVDALAAKVARRHLSAPRAHHADSWMRAVFYSGLLALDGAEWEEAVRQICAELEWRPKHRVYHADDHAIGQSYVELFRRRQDPAMIAPLRARFDYIRAHPFARSLDRSETLDPHAEWSWCDALYMAPPTWAGLARVTGEAAYLDFALAGWWKTSDFLYDREAHLFHRDSTTMTHREPNGAKVFWGRGNGWVVAGLVRVLEQLPAGHPGRARLEQQLREMAAALVALQPLDGLWRSSLLDPASYPVPETSGSGLICYALAWGINHGVLDRSTYLPATLRAWHGLAGCVTTEGKLTHVQAIGAAPTNFDPASTEDYGVGAFLLAASEVKRLPAP